MSECVVRMEMPRSCTECRFNVDGWCYAISEYDKQPSEVHYLTRPEWCPIICSLPEGHGRLIDSDALIGVLGIMGDKGGDPVVWMQMRYIAEDMHTIVPAERSET